MTLTEKESNVLNYLRYPAYAMNEIMQGNKSPVDNLSDEEIVSLYNKMDAVIEDEGNTRQSLGSFDEMYVLELSGVKKSLYKEIKKRGLRKTVRYKKYCEEYFALLDMYRCSTRYIHTQEYDNEETRNQHLQTFRKIYQKHSDRLEKKCKKHTGYGFSHEDMKQNYFTEKEEDICF